MNLNPALVADALRAVRNHRYERADDGRLFVPGANAFIGGFTKARYAPPDSDDFGPWSIGPNKVVDEGINFLLNLLGGHIDSVALYLAPFSGNVTPNADWTGANFAANATEFTAYTAANRVPWTTVSTTTKQLTNAAALAAATITLAAGGPYTLRGVGLLGSPAKNGTTGPLIVAARFPDSDLIGLAAGGKVALQYDVNAIDEGDA